MKIISQTLKKSFFVVMFGVVSTSIVAQQSSDTLSLTLEDAQVYAVQHNQMMKNATLDEKIAEAERWQTIATMLPQAKADYAYTNFLGHELDMMGMKIPMDPTGAFTAQASIALSGQQIVGAMLGTDGMRLAEINAKKTAKDIKANVTKTYMQILLTEVTLNLLNDNKKNIETLYESTVEAVRVGVSEETDADQLLVQVASMQNVINQTERGLELLRNSLKVILGVPFDQPIALKNTLDDLVNAEKQLELLNEPFDIRRNHDYQLLEKQTELTKKQIRLAEWEYGPQLAAFYQYYNQQTFGDEGFNMTPPHSVGVSVSMPIFSSGQRFNKVRAAKTEYEKMLNTKQQTTEQLMIQNSQLRFNLNSAYENFKVQQKNWEVVERVFKSTSQKFKYGTASALDLTQANTNLINAQTNYVSALTELVNAHVELQLLLNK
ncbi:MAG: TolC family protein [Paludibacteraceae bacterium]|nr:TolC family protein [Paludibacteraceae bacterium]